MSVDCFFRFACASTIMVFGGISQLKPVNRNWEFTV